ncbi:MAG: hypothetical protein GDYSWBUE_000607 [Candidatus Fervidibacterota bacterium]
MRQWHEPYRITPSVAALPSSLEQPAEPSSASEPERVGWHGAMATDHT